jgi:hypothetical protein
MGGSKGLGYYALCALAVLGIAGCSEKRADENVGTVAQPLSATTQRTFGFESLEDWSPLWSSPTLSLSSVRSQGEKSLSLAGGGWMVVTSRALTKEDNGDLIYDIRPADHYWD